MLIKIEPAFRRPSISRVSVPVCVYSRGALYYKNEHVVQE